MEVAASKGLPPLKHHLLPRTKGFTTAVQCLRGTGEGRAPEPAKAGRHSASELRVNDRTGAMSAGFTYCKIPVSLLR